MTKASTLVFVVFATLAPSVVDGFRRNGASLSRALQAESAAASSAKQKASVRPCAQPDPYDLPKDSKCAGFRYTKTCFVEEEHCWAVSDEEVDVIVDKQLKTQPSNFEKKRAIVLAGGMASGRSTALRDVTNRMGVSPEEFVQGGYYDVMKELPQYKSHKKNREQFKPRNNGNAQAGAKWEHMVGLQGSCRDVIRPAKARIVEEASKRELNVISQGFDGISEIVKSAELCYDITLVTVKSNADEAVCRVWARQDDEEGFKDIEAVKTSYNNVQNDFLTTRVALKELFSEKGYLDTDAKPEPKHVKMCPGARFFFYNCDNTGKEMTCSSRRTQDAWANPEWAEVWDAYDAMKMLENLGNFSNIITVRFTGSFELPLGLGLQSSEDGKHIVVQEVWGEKVRSEGVLPGMRIIEIDRSWGADGTHEQQVLSSPTEGWYSDQVRWNELMGSPTEGWWSDQGRWNELMAPFLSWSELWPDQGILTMAFAFKGDKVNAVKEVKDYAGLGRTYLPKVNQNVNQKPRDMDMPPEVNPM